MAPPLKHQHSFHKCAASGLPADAFNSEPGCCNGTQGEKWSITKFCSSPREALLIEWHPAANSRSAWGSQGASYPCTSALSKCRQTGAWVLIEYWVFELLELILLVTIPTVPCGHALVFSLQNLGHHLLDQVCWEKMKGAKSKYWSNWDLSTVPRAFLGSVEVYTILFNIYLICLKC